MGEPSWGGSYASLPKDSFSRLPLRIKFNQRSNRIATAFYRALTRQGVSPHRIDAGRRDGRISAEEVFSFVDDHNQDPRVRAALKRLGLKQPPWINKQGQLRPEFDTPEFKSLTFTQKLAHIHGTWGRIPGAKDAAYHLRYAALLDPGNFKLKRGAESPPIPNAEEDGFSNNSSEIPQLDVGAVTGQLLEEIGSPECRRELSELIALAETHIQFLLPLGEVAAGAEVLQHLGRLYERSGDLESGKFALARAKFLLGDLEASQSLLQGIPPTSALAPHVEKFSSQVSVLRERQQQIQKVLPQLTALEQMRHKVVEHWEFEKSTWRPTWFTSQEKVDREKAESDHLIAQAHRGFDALEQGLLSGKVETLQGAFANLPDLVRATGLEPTGALLSGEGFRDNFLRNIVDVARLEGLAKLTDVRERERWLLEYTKDLRDNFGALQGYPIRTVVANLRALEVAGDPSVREDAQALFREVSGEKAFTGLDDQAYATLLREGSIGTIPMVMAMMLAGPLGAIAEGSVAATQIGNAMNTAHKVSLLARSVGFAVEGVSFWAAHDVFHASLIGGGEYFTGRGLIHSLAFLGGIKAIMAGWQAAVGPVVSKVLGRAPHWQIPVLGASQVGAGMAEWAGFWVIGKGLVGLDSLLGQVPEQDMTLRQELAHAGIGLLQLKLAMRAGNIATGHFSQIQTISIKLETAEGLFREALAQGRLTKETFEEAVRQIHGLQKMLSNLQGKEVKYSLPGGVGKKGIFEPLLAEARLAEEANQRAKESGKGDKGIFTPLLEEARAAEAFSQKEGLPDADRDILKIEPVAGIRVKIHDPAAKARLDLLREPVRLLAQASGLKPLGKRGALMQWALETSMTSEKVQEMTREVEEGRLSIEVKEGKIRLEELLPWAAEEEFYEVAGQSAPAPNRIDGPHSMDLLNREYQEYRRKRDGDPMIRFEEELLHRATQLGQDMELIRAIQGLPVAEQSRAWDIHQQFIQRMDELRRFGAEDLRRTAGDLGPETGQYATYLKNRTALETLFAQLDSLVKNSRSEAVAPGEARVIFLPPVQVQVEVGHPAKSAAKVQRAARKASQATEIDVNERSFLEKSLAIEENSPKVATGVERNRALTCELPEGGDSPSVEKLVGRGQVPLVGTLVGLGITQFLEGCAGNGSPALWTLGIGALTALGVGAYRWVKGLGQSSAKPVSNPILVGRSLLEEPEKKMDKPEMFQFREENLDLVDKVSTPRWSRKESKPSFVEAITEEGDLLPAGGNLSEGKKIKRKTPSNREPTVAGPRGENKLVPAATLSPSGEWSFSGEAKKLFIGRNSREVNISLTNRWVSKRHAAIFSHEGDFWMEDLGSVMGTSLNDKPLAKGIAQQLRGGDQIGFAKRVLFQFDVDANGRAKLTPVLRLSPGIKLLPIGGQVMLKKFPSGEVGIQNRGTRVEVNGKSLSPDGNFRHLRDGDRITVGERAFIFRNSNI